MNPFPFVLAQWHQSRSTLMAMALLIAIGCAISLGVTSIERAVREASTRAANRFDLIVGAAGNETQLVLTTVYLQPAALKLMSNEVLKRLQADPGVVYAAPFSTGDSFAGSPIVGTTKDFISDQRNAVLSSGRWFDDHGEAVVGSSSSLRIGDTYTPLHGSANENAIETHEHTGHVMRVVGRMSPTGTPWDSAIMVPFESVLELHQHGDHGVGPPAIIVKPRSIMDAYRLRQIYRSGSTTAVFPAETLTSLYRTLGDVRELVFWVASAGQVLVLAAVLLGLYATLSARAQALAALRAMGANRVFIWLILWLQALAMLVVGFAVGVMTTVVLSSVVTGFLTGKLGLAIDARMIASDFRPLMAMFVVGALSAGLVAWRVYVEPLSEALKN
jgi:putative ABC transport system permease protein